MADTFECAGATVSVVDPAGIIATATAERVDLLSGAEYPAPVREVRLFLMTDVDDTPVHVLEGEVSTAPRRPPFDVSSFPVLGNDPIGALLARRVAAGDPWAVKFVDGVTGAVQWLAPPRPSAVAGMMKADPHPVREDEATGLRATVVRTGTLTTLRSTVPSDAMTADHLRAMCRLLFGLVEEQAGSLDGRAYVVRRPIARARAETTATVTLDDVGGLDAVVAQFRQVAVSFRHPEVMARWGARRPQGILLYGPPGTGKTMLARALANEIGADFREVRTPEILDKWLGGSERNIKRIFREARAYRQPTVMLFDEFDSIISYTGGGQDAAGQAINAVAGIFKQEMNNLIEENPRVIVVATTNFPQRVDESLVRSGRFDIKIAIPPPDERGRGEIFTKMIQQRADRYETPGFTMFADDLVPAVLAAASAGMTGADIREVLRRVQLAKAMQEARTGIPAPPISQADLERHIADLRRGGAPTA